MPYFLAIIAIVALSSPFGPVEGKAVSDEAGLTVQITIEVDRAFEAVLVRPFSAYEELPPTALVFIDTDMWGGLVNFPTAEDWALVFDGIESDGASSRSESVTLTEIGVDPLVVADEPARLPGRSIDSSTWWLIGAGVFALAALAALAWWTFANEDS
ncbi:MAG: hypothetical protein BMS9Abin12_0129 [Acidimicrobiia bacterium]|nr:MAG: hypothetical protein BMS9Abin12_0129 [Acidimicrobiia bacterium]